MRNFINIMNEAIQIDHDSSPEENEAADAPHYDALRKTGFFGEQAAGAILMAKTTGRIMLCLRSGSVEQPYTWGNCGGAFHSDERPIDAAKREVYEETGYTGGVTMVPLFVFKSGTFRYSNFLAIVEDEFVPNLGWEADDHVWVDYGDWPSPLHFGMTALFSDSESERVIEHYAKMFQTTE
jgi:8-oxo-dGTP pyrophosphatase MutT (NUDIX family)